MRKPRQFSHSYIYVDSRRERLAAIEQQARRELGMDEPTAAGPERLRGVFALGQHHVRRRQERGGLSTQRLLLLIFILALIWYLLL